MSGSDQNSGALERGEEAVTQGSEILSYGDVAVAQGDAVLLAYGPPPKTKQKKQPSKRKSASPHKQARTTAVELRKIFESRFSRYGPKGTFNKNVKITVVPEADWSKELRKEADRLLEWHVRQRLKLFPGEIQAKLNEKYQNVGEQYPYAQIDENTKLRKSDHVFLFGTLRAGLVTDAVNNYDAIGGFYSLSQRRIYAKESNRTHGVLAHELAHAFGSQRWLDAMSILSWRGMANVGDQGEGITSHIAKVVTVAYSHQKNTTIPQYGYGGKYQKLIKELISQVGEDALLEAYFGGHIDITDRDNPGDSLKVGSGKKPLKWPWQ